MYKHAILILLFISYGASAKEFNLRLIGNLAELSSVAIRCSIYNNIIGEQPKDFQEIGIMLGREFYKTLSILKYSDKAAYEELIDKSPPQYTIVSVGLSNKILSDEFRLGVAFSRTQHDASIKVRMFTKMRKIVREDITESKMAIELYEKEDCESISNMSP